MNPIEVACAVVVRDRKVLATRRGVNMAQPLKWEFPGGKVEQGETPQEALVREIAEELGIEIEVGIALSSVVHHYENISIELIPFLALLRKGNIQLAEHDAYCWASSEELKALDWTPADVPVVEEVVKIISQG